MPDFAKLPAWTKDGNVHVVVETPRGARAKMKFDLDLEVFTYTKPLMAGLSLPFDFGFIPSTLAEDGDPLDAMVLHDAETWPGMVIRCRVIGAVKVAQREKKGPRVRNDRLMVVPEEDHRGEDLKDARRLPRAMRDELERFFAASVVLKKKDLEFLGWVGPKDAEKLICAAEKEWQEKQLG
jgi:inorganic pyrophosphatase